MFPWKAKKTPPFKKKEGGFQGGGKGFLVEFLFFFVFRFQKRVFLFGREKKIFWVPKIFFFKGRAKRGVFLAPQGLEKGFPQKKKGKFFPAFKKASFYFFGGGTFPPPNFFIILN